MRFTPSIALAFVVAFAPQIAAQDPTLHAGLGYSNYDLSGVGDTWVGLARYSTRPSGPFRFEIGTTYFHYETAFGETTWYLFPEVSALLQLPRGPLRPYVAAGAGLTVALKGNGGGRPTLHGAAGLDMVFGRVGIRSEFRLRAVDPWGAVTADLTVGPTLGL
jgi:hypothetical protein